MDHVRRGSVVALYGLRRNHCCWQPSFRAVRWPVVASCSRTVVCAGVGSFGGLAGHLQAANGFEAVASSPAARGPASLGMATVRARAARVVRSGHRLRAHPAGEVLLRRAV
jgi:hypothetical protein